MCTKFPGNGDAAGPGSTPGDGHFLSPDGQLTWQWEIPLGPGANKGFYKKGNPLKARNVLWRLWAQDSANFLTELDNKKLRLCGPHRTPHYHTQHRILKSAGPMSGWLDISGSHKAADYSTATGLCFLMCTAVRSKEKPQMEHTIKSHVVCSEQEGFTK